MASAQPADTVAVGFDPLACASCGEPYTSETCDGIPTLLSCGHCICAACYTAISVMSPMKCIICQSVVSDTVVKNMALAAYCDTVRSGIEPQLIPDLLAPIPPRDDKQADANAPVPNRKKGRGRGAKRTRAESIGSEDGQASSHPAVSCAHHPDTPATTFCVKDAVLICSKCAGSKHKAKSHGAVKLSAAAALPALQAQCTRDAATFEKLSQFLTSREGYVPETAARLRANTEDACERMVKAVEALKHVLDEHCRASVAALRSICRSRLKELDARHDELLVSASELSLGAKLCTAKAACTDAVDIAKTLQTLQSMKALCTRYDAETSDVLMLESKGFVGVHIDLTAVERVIHANLVVIEVSAWGECNLR